MSGNVLLTEFGFKKLRDELEILKRKERPFTLIELEEARQQGDLKENAEYHAAKEKLSHIDNKISEIEQKIANSKIVAVGEADGTVRFGSVVTVHNSKFNKEQKYTIVSSEETDLKKLHISIESPIGKALLAAVVGEVVYAEIPSGKIELKVLVVE